VGELEKDADLAERELVCDILDKLHGEMQTIEESDWMFEPPKATR
jgi:hypothetical protein